MKRKKIYLILVPLLAGFLISLAVNAASAPPGSSGNPVISRSYAEKVLQPLRDQVEQLEFEVARLKGAASRGDQQKFIDVPSTYWAYNDITFMVEKGIITGLGEGRFGPALPATRAQLAVMVVKTLGLPTTGVNADFNDVAKNHWAYAHIAAAQNAGIISGFPGGIFKPDDYITRGQMAAMLAKAFRLERNYSTGEFKDVAKDYWAYDAIQKLADNGISKGYEDRTFRPEAKVTRAEVAVFLAKAIVNTNKN